MCLVAFAYKQREDASLILCANRDEFRSRGALPAAVWDDHHLIYGGRDLVSGGSWLTISTRAPYRLACVTNVREPAQEGEAPHSRGLLVSAFTRSTLSSEAFLERVTLEEYGACNLILYDGDSLWYASNRAAGGERAVTARALSPGVYGLSNAQLDTPWPKTVATRAALEGALDAARSFESQPLDDQYRYIRDEVWGALSDPQVYPDESLPHTGVPQALERSLSAALITGDHYGTRSQAFALLCSSHARFEERLLDAAGGVTHSAQRRFEAHSGATP